MRETKPDLLPTGRHARNVIIAGFVVAALIAAGIVFFVNVKPGQNPLLNADAIESTPVVVKEVQTQTGSTNNNPQKASEVIREYYDALAAKSPDALHKIGAEDAAAAADHHWLDGIGLVVDTSKTSLANKDEFPPSVGIYAGCSLYRIADFYESPPQDAIKTDITGLTTVQGWVYYNPMTSSWVVVDPTIPTAVSAASSTTVERSSGDFAVNVKLTCPGAYSNPWWCFARIDVEATNTGTEKVAHIYANSFDGGITLNVPEELLGDLLPATPKPGGETGTPTANNTSDPNAAPVMEASRKTGTIIFYRGVTSAFNIDRIGQKPQELDGDISPLKIEYENENLTPVFAIGKATTDEVQAMIIEEQIEKYKATKDAVEIDPNYPTEFADANTNAENSENANANTNANSNSNGSSS